MSSLLRMVLASSAKRGMSLPVSSFPFNAEDIATEAWVEAVYALEGRDDLAVLFGVHTVLESVGGLYVSGVKRLSGTARVYELRRAARCFLFDMILRQRAARHSVE
jgi:hypothetical protein